MRFIGQPRESAASLGLKPFFDARIVYRFARSDFHPMPSVDAVLLHLHRTEPPDLPADEAGAWRAFSRTALEKCRARETAGDTLYVQWLCLFRRGRRARSKQ
jgi:23S rRNA (adenine-N6)-dimethyltransferase